MRQGYLAPFLLPTGEKPARRHHEKQPRSPSSCPKSGTVRPTPSTRRQMEKGRDEHQPSRSSGSEVVLPSVGSSPPKVRHSSQRRYRTGLRDHIVSAPVSLFSSGAALEAYPRRHLAMNLATRSISGRLEKELRGLWGEAAERVKASTKPSSPPGAIGAPASPRPGGHPAASSPPGAPSRENRTAPR